MSTKAAIWTRVSTDRQHEDNQIPDLERLCQHRGWEITRRYEIADASTYKGEHRLALQRMLDDAHRGEFSVLVIWAVDRLCRQGIEAAADPRVARAQRLAAAIKSPGSTAPTRPPSCWPPSPHGSRRRSPCDGPSGSAPAWHAAGLRASRWAGPLRSEAKTSTRVAPTATSRHGCGARQRNRGRLSNGVKTATPARGVLRGAPLRPDAAQPRNRAQCSRRPPAAAGR